MRGLTDAERAMLAAFDARSESTISELPILDGLVAAGRVRFIPDPPGTGFAGEHKRTRLGKLALRLWPATKAIRS